VEQDLAIIKHLRGLEIEIEETDLVAVDEVIHLPQDHLHRLLHPQASLRILQINLHFCQICLKTIDNKNT